VREPLSLVATNYGNLSTLDVARPTIHIHPLRAEPSAFKLDNTKPVQGQLPVQPILDWDEDARIAGALLLKKRDLSCLDNFPKLKPHADLMYNRLLFHKQNFSGYFPDPIWMVGKSLLEGPSFTNNWLDEWKIARFRWMNMKFNIEPDHEPSFTMDSYSSTYLGYHFIFWKEEVNDYEAMFGGVPDTDPELLSELQEFVSRISEDLLSDEEILEEPPLDFVYRPVATGGFTGDKTHPSWSIEYDAPEWDIDEEVMICARSQAPKRPGETRDIGIMRPSSLHFHRRFMYLLQKACKRISGCPYGKDPDVLRRIVTKIGSDKEYFYMRDYTKSGMTIPHSVQGAILRGFYARRPELAEKAARFFSDQQLFFKNDDGSYRLERPDTGSPLGMFVEGYTLFQYALHNMNLSQISAEAKHFLFSATNDDMVVGNNDRDELEEYLLADERNNSALGMSYKDTKSGISHNRFVFCEEYWIDDYIDPKSALFATTLIGARSSFNPFHAKEYCYSVLLSAGEITPQILKALHDVQSHVGYEFHEQEFKWPYLFGGWLPQIKQGLDHSIEWYDGDLKASAGYWANQVHLPKKGSLSQEPHLTIGRKLNVKMICEPEDIKHWVDLVPLFGTRRTLERHYRTGLSSPISVLKEYNLLSKYRMQAYTNYISGKREIPSVYKDYIMRHPSTFIPTDMPYLTLSEPITRVTYPRLGVKDQTFIAKMIMLRHAGYIDLDIPGTATGTSVFLAEHGICDPFSYKYLPVGHKGVSTFILSNHVMGYTNYYERTGKIIESVGTDDIPLREASLWAYMPWASLLTTIRMFRFGETKLRKTLELGDLVRLGEAHRKISEISNPEPEEESEDDEAQVAPTITDSELMIAALVRDVIRDWVPDPDLVVDGMQSRIFSRVSQLTNTETASRLAAFVSDDVSLGPEATRGGDTNEGSGSDGNPDDVFDPWGELGV